MISAEYHQSIHSSPTLRDLEENKKLKGQSLVQFRYPGRIRLIPIFITAAAQLSFVAMLSSGAIAGIVIGSLVGLIIFIGVPLYVILRRRKAAASLTQTSGSATPAVNLSTPYPSAVAAPQKPSNKASATTAVAPAPHAGGYVPYASHGEPSGMAPSRLPHGGSFDPNVEVKMPQQQTTQSDRPDKPHSFQGMELPSSGYHFPAGSGQEPVNFGSMQVKGIRDVKGDREPGPTW